MPVRVFSVRITLSFGLCITQVSWGLVWKREVVQAGSERYNIKKKDMVYRRRRRKRRRIHMVMQESGKEAKHKA